MILRRQFLSVCSALGLAGIGLKPIPSDFNGSVLIVGAGVAGMSVGHLLSQRKIKFTILEAAPSYGGRVKTSHEFVDFPIPLGGEWLHVNEKILPKIINDASIEIETKITKYVPECTYGYYENGHLQVDIVGDNEDDLKDKKFVNGSWLTFFEKHIVPGIKSRMQFDSQVTSIDYSRKSVEVKCANGKKFSADAVVITVPPQIIKDGDISFRPKLPPRKLKAFDDAYIWGGMKMFFQFQKKFYPTFLEIARTNNDQGEKLYYDAAYGQNSKANVLGIFTVGDQSKPYQSRKGNDLRDYVLAELDKIFDGAATRNYMQHISQNWNEEPFIRQAYYASSANWRLPPRMRKSVGQKLYFAGDTYTSGGDWGSAHAAALSARKCVDELIG